MYSLEKRRKDYNKLVYKLSCILNVDKPDCIFTMSTLIDNFMKKYKLGKYDKE